MSQGWRYLLAGEVAEFIMNRRAREREFLFKIIRGLTENPYVVPEFSLRDNTGREISFITRQGFHIGFWLDHFVKEVRIVDLDQS